MRKIIVLAIATFSFLLSSNAQVIIARVKFNNGSTAADYNRNNMQEYSKKIGEAKKNLAASTQKLDTAKLKLNIAKLKLDTTNNKKAIGDYINNKQIEEANARIEQDSAQQKVINDQNVLIDLQKNGTPKNVMQPNRVNPIAGSFSFPFKFRPTSGTFETNYSLSLVGGFEFTSDPLNDSTNHLFSGYFGIGSSSITLNSNNSSVTSASTRNAITFSFTFMYEWQGLQFAISTGIDENMDNTTDKWKYQGKPWLSAGIGFSIFSQKTK